MKRNLGLVLFSILIALIFLEISLRILLPEKNIIPKPPTQWVKVPEQVWSEPHPMLGWYHQKNKTAVLKKGALEIPIHTNSMGFRGSREYQIQQPTSVTRILSLGDSFTFGWGVEDNETFSAQLEKQNSNFEVLNLGVSGYGLDQIYLSYQLIGKQFHADYVLITIFPEDFWRSTRSFTDSGYSKPYFRLTRRNQLVLENSPVRPPEEIRSNFKQFPEIIEYGPVEHLLLHSALYRFLKKKTLHLARDFGWVDPDLTEEWRLGRSILKNLLDEVRRTGARPILVVVPPMQWMELTEPTSIQKSLVRFARQEGVEIIDSTPTLKEKSIQSGVDKFYIKDDEHWTSKGHDILANFLLQYLKTQTQENRETSSADKSIN